MKELYKEVYEELVKLVGEEKATAINNAYDSMEKELKFSNLELLSMPNLESFKFPYTVNEFKEQLNLLLDFIKKAKNTRVEDCIKNIIESIPENKNSTVTSYSWYNPNESSYEYKNNRVSTKDNPRPLSEPELENIRKIISDFIFMNELDVKIRDDLSDMINYFSDRISNNIEGSLVFTNIKLMRDTSKIKLAAYFNLHTNNKYSIESPELCVSGNRALIELSLYNAFLAGIVKLVSFWKQRIFNKIDKTIVTSKMQFDFIYKAISCEIDKVVSEYLDDFVCKMCNLQGKSVVNKHVELTDSELLALEELFVTRLRKPVPRKYTYQWEKYKKPDKK